MESKIIGQLKVHTDIDEWYESEAISIPLLGGHKLSFTIEDIDEDENPDEFDEAISNFIELDESLKSEIETYVYKSYLEFKEAVGPEYCPTNILDPSGVWQYVYPSYISVSRRPYGNEEIYVQLLAECEWEPEHGLQIVFHKGKTLNRVSDQDGHLTHSDAYALPEEQDRIC
ncbi:MAG: hypothetical protein GY951_11380 [Psychromonas sp.]|nr:hypothetical protein [Psychromonas sp.]